MSNPLPIRVRPRLLAFVYDLFSPRQIGGCAAQETMIPITTIIMALAGLLTLVVGIIVFVLRRRGERIELTTEQQKMADALDKAFGKNRKWGGAGAAESEMNEHSNHSDHSGSGSSGGEAAD